MLLWDIVRMLCLCHAGLGKNDSIHNIIAQKANSKLCVLQTTNAIGLTICMCIYLLLNGHST